MLNVKTNCLRYKLMKQVKQQNIPSGVIVHSCKLFSDLCRTPVTALPKEPLGSIKPSLRTTAIGAGSGVPGGAQAPPELFLAPPEPFEPPLTIEKIMH